MMNSIRKLLKSTSPQESPITRSDLIPVGMHSPKGSEKVGDCRGESTFGWSGAEHANSSSIDRRSNSGVPARSLGSVSKRSGDKPEKNGFDPNNAGHYETTEK